MAKAAVCPDLTQYRQLAAGKLADTAEEALLKHLEGCDACAHKMTTLAEPDTLVELIRREQAQCQRAAAGILGRLVERLSKLRPGELTAGAALAKSSAPEPAPASPLVFACPTCGKGLKVKGELAGTKVKCPHCQQAMRVPAASANGQARGPQTGSPAALGNLSPEPARRLDASTVDGGNALSGIAASSAGQPLPTAVWDKNPYDFLAPPQAADELGRLGPYRVLQVLGAGGMGVVFRAEDPQLARLVALKAMLPALATSAIARERFVREARAAAALKHDHIVTIHQVGEDRGVPFLAMEFLEGESLDARLERAGKLPVAEVLRIGREIALGLAAAHQRGLIHRDIKPANVWLEAETGRVKILDFGLARVVGAEDKLTQQGAIVGTPAYMAPEQAQGQNLDPRSDLFSLGSVLYRMVTGAKPFQGSDMISTLIAVSTHQPPAPLQLDPGVSPGLSAFIMSLLAKEAASRPPTAQAVAHALERHARAPASRPSAQDSHLFESPARTAVKFSPRQDVPVEVIPTLTPKPREQKDGRQDQPWRGKRAKKGWATAGVGIALLAVLIGLWAGGVIRVRTPDGILFIDVNEPNPEVFVDGKQVTVTWDKGGKKAEVRIRPGTRMVEVKKDGFTVIGGEVKLKDGDRHTLTARFEPITTPQPPGSVPAKTEPERLRVSPSPSAALEALRRDQVPPEALKMAGDGDPNKAPASLVGVLGEAQSIHTDTVRCLAFSADGRWLASASFDKTILLRDAATGRVQRVFKGHTSWVMSVAFSRDGRTLVSASHDGTLKLWPLDRAAGPQTLQPKLGEIWDMAVSADGRFLAAGGTGGGVRLWKWGQWDKPLDIMPAGAKDWIHFNGNRSASLAFSSDGGLLAVGRREDDMDAPIHLYKTSDGKLARTLPGQRGQEYYPLNMTFSRDDKYLAYFLGGYKARVWDMAAGKVSAEFPAGQFGCVALSPDGKALAVGGRGRGDFYDLTSQTVLRSLSAGHYWCFSGAFSPDGKLFAAGFSNGLVHVWDTTTWKEKYLERGHLQHVRGLAIRPDGSKILSAGNDDTLRQWDLARPGTNQILHHFTAEDFYPGNSPSSSAAVAYDPTGKRFALLVKGNGFLRPRDDTGLSVWDAATLKKRWTVPLWLDSIVFSPDGKTVAGGCRDGMVRLWDADLGTELHRFGSLGTCSGLAFSKDGKLLAAASQDKEGCIKVWSVASGAEVHSWKDTSMTVAAFRPDGRILAVGHKDGTISVWDLAEGKKKRTLKGHSAQVQSLKFTPDGKTLVSSGHDGTIRVWNPEWERARQIIPLGPANQRLMMDLDPSGRYLIAAGHGPLIYVLRLPTGEVQGAKQK